MHKTSTIVLTALAVIILAGLLTNPTGMYMPEPMVAGITVLFFVAFGALAIFVLKEQARDEREESIRMRAGRAAFIAGGAVLVLGIGIQGLQHSVDVWLVAALVVMILAKIITHLIN